jgi:hypothetical protein
MAFTFLRLKRERDLPSAAGLPAVLDQDLTGDERRLVGLKEDDRMGNLFRLGETLGLARPEDGSR